MSGLHGSLPVLAVHLAGAALAAGPAACSLPVLAPSLAPTGVAPARALSRACPGAGEVDRIEGGLAVVVRPGGDVVDCPAEGLHEGDVLRHGRVDRAATARLAADVARLRARLAQGDDGADLDL